MPDTPRSLDQLTHHAHRLDQLIHLLGHPLRVDRSRERVNDLAEALYRDIRFALKQDYEAGEPRTWSRADAVSLTALYDAYAALGTGRTTRPQRLLNNAHRAHRVIARAIREIEHDADAR